MLLGFPNLDGSFTCALHIPFEGDLSFDSIKSEAILLDLFERSFPDAIPYMPDLVSDFFSNPPNSMVTIKCLPWSYQDRAILIGDAAHAIYPSYGQGANAGFEDCAILDSYMAAGPRDWKAVFRKFETLRKPDTDAIADLCIEHFVELRDLVGNPRFLLRREIERRLNRMHPARYRDLYSMITFTCMSYKEALRIDRTQRAIIDQIMATERIEDRVNTPEIDELLNQVVESGLAFR